MHHINQQGLVTATSASGTKRTLCRPMSALSEKQKSLLRELEQSFGGAAGEKNSPHSKSFPDGVKKFFDDLTR